MSRAKAATMVGEESGSEMKKRPWWRKRNGV